MKTLLRLLPLLLLASTFCLSADRDTKVLIDAEHAFAKATAERGVDGWMEFMAPNAVVLSAEPLVGLDQIRAGMGKQFNTPGFALTANRRSGKAPISQPGSSRKTAPGK